MATSILSGMATGQEASLPSSTYLRKRYKKLQRCKVSQAAASEEANASNPSKGSVNPSFQAIRALNGQPGAAPEPLVVHAMIKDARRVVSDRLESRTSTPTDRLPSTPQRLASSHHESESFSARVDKLVQAVDRGQHIRFAPSNRDGRVDVFASAAVTHDYGSGSRVTEQATLPQEISERVYGRRPGSPFPMLDLAGDTQQDQLINTQASKRSGLLIISETQRRHLADRIDDEIARSATRNQRVSLETVIHQKRRPRVDPRVLRTHGRNGIERRIISPIPLDYHKPRTIATPSVSTSESCSISSSPLDDVLTRQAAKTKRPVYSIPSNRSAIATAGGNSWFPELTPSERGSSANVDARPRKGKRDPLEWEEKHPRVVRWLHHVKEALGGKKKPPPTKPRKAISVYQDKPSNSSDGWAEMLIPRPDNALRDLTNVRQPGYLAGNSFAQEKEMRDNARTRINAQSRVRPQPAVEPMHPTGRLYVKANRPQAQPNSRRAERQTTANAHKVSKGHVVIDPSTSPVAKFTTSSQASTVKPFCREEALHPDVDFALARLEGRAPPPPSSPIRRCRDDTETYGADVELELGRMTLDCPQPLTPVALGEWTAKFEGAVDAGFDCALEAPLSPGTRGYFDSLA
ncbi:MAG: hypothetical protein LQ338_000646 [Usnochroma carphineum]|nr:MAG: hypothetical protein LQ338_000646 [Usnochroma carphineum]